MSALSNARGRVPWAGTPISSTVAVHAEEASFLWLLRDKAVHASHYRLKELRDLDERIDGHLQGIRLAGSAGLAICRDVVELTDAGEVFAYAASVVAAGANEAIRMVLDVALADSELRRGFVSALSWLPWSTVQQPIASMLKSGEPLRASVATATLALRRIDPGASLLDSIEHENESLRIAALRAVGLLGRRDLLESVKKAAIEGSVSARCAAAWSGSVLCDRVCANQLYELLAHDEAPWREELLRLAFRRFNNEGATRLRELSRHAKQRRDVVIAAGALGDPAVVPWLIERMGDPDLARVAGEAFSVITGAHFEIDQLWQDPARLNREPPSLFGVESPQLQEEVVEPDADTGSPADRDLYWPDVDKVKAWWARNETRFRKGGRYLVGRDLTKESLQDVLQNGYQRHRSAAALELVAFQPEQPLTEVRARACRRRVE